MNPGATAVGSTRNVQPENRQNAQAAPGLMDRFQSVTQDVSNFVPETRPVLTQAIRPFSFLPAQGALIRFRPEDPWMLTVGPLQLK